jgi:AcrR family transcriptional regulator
MPKAKRAQMQPRTRNRDATMQRICDAARRLIAAKGFAALGVNAVAAEAGCDKKLIARYFGGIGGLAETLGGELGFWLGPELPSARPDASYAETMSALLAGYDEALRANPLLQQVLIWELAETSPALQRIDELRSVAVGGWMAKARGASRPPAEVDAPAINAILLAALHYLTLRERTLGSFVGVQLKTPADRDRIRTAMDWLLQRAYSPKATNS